METAEQVANGIVYQRALAHALAGAILSGAAPGSLVKLVLGEAIEIATETAESTGVSLKECPAAHAFFSGEMIEGVFSERLIEHCRSDWDSLIEALRADDFVIAVDVASLDDQLADLLGGDEA